MPIHTVQLVKNTEVIARLNFLRDVAMMLDTDCAEEDDIFEWEKLSKTEKKLYLKEAECEYVLTLDEIKAIEKLVSRNLNGNIIPDHR
jgi:hypothetical protein